MTDEPKPSTRRTSQRHASSDRQTTTSRRRRIAADRVDADPAQAEMARKLAIRRMILLVVLPLLFLIVAFAHFQKWITIPGLRPEVVVENTGPKGPTLKERWGAAQKLYQQADQLFLQATQFKGEHEADLQAAREEINAHFNLANDKVDEAIRSAEQILAEDASIRSERGQNEALIKAKHRKWQKEIQNWGLVKGDIESLQVKDPEEEDEEE